MMKTVTAWLLLGALVSSYVVPTSELWAGERCCARCGCRDQVSKVCRFVKEEKKVTVVCWGVLEEDFCLNGPSCPGCTHCEPACKKDLDDKLESKVSSQAKAFSWTEWIAKHHASLFTKKKLMKKTVTKTVPSFRWVVEDCCEQCKSK